jgi:hypothetical protein
VTLDEYIQRASEADKNRPLLVELAGDEQEKGEGCKEEKIEEQHQMYRI